LFHFNPFNFLYIIFQRHESEGSRFGGGTLVKELGLIETSEVQEITTSSKEMLLWIYFVGGIISDERGIIA
jgi:hypothetical protein